MNILIINPFGIGDVLFTSPVIHALKEKFPGKKLGFLCNKRTFPLLKANPHLDEVLVYERDDFARLLSESWFKWYKEFKVFIKSIRRNKFDLAIDLSLNTNFSFFLFLAGIKRRIGYNYKNRGFYLTESINLSGYDNKHIVEYYKDILQLIGLKSGFSELELYLDKEDILYVDKIFLEKQIGPFKKLVVISPGGGASWGKDAYLKQWPEDSYAFLADKIIEKYEAKVIILGDSSEEYLCKHIETKAKNKVINLQGLLTVGQLGAIINKADLFLGNDGGPLHMAVALGKKTVSFFGPVDPKVYGPYPVDKNRHIVLRRILDCTPCYRKFRLGPCQKKKECLEKIDPGQALEAVDELIGRSSH